ncbi:MAG: beta-1,6-N-acetylglucosaminyltransferase [Pseudomonadota bacterium]
MDIAYLILAHDQPTHLRALIECLSTRDSHFYVHIDRKSRLEDFDLPRSPRVHVLQERVRVFWGDYSQVEAIVTLMRAALAQPGQRHPRFVLLSGADYPVRSNAFIHHFFEKHEDLEFINLERMPTADGCKTLTRLTSYQPLKTSSRVLNRLKRGAQRVGLLPRERDFDPALGDMQPYGGHTWWALTRAAVEHVLVAMEANPVYVDFCRHTFCPDEHCFHTLLGNSPFADKVRCCPTYADWSRRSHRPENLTLAHAEFLTHNPTQPPSRHFPQGMPFLFARKFTAESQELLRVLRARLSEDASGSANQASTEVPPMVEQVPA